MNESHTQVQMGLLKEGTFLFAVLSTSRIDVARFYFESFKLCSSRLTLTDVYPPPPSQEAGRRLITGANDGTTRMWNFSNGQCLKELQGQARHPHPCLWRHHSPLPLAPPSPRL